MFDEGETIVSPYSPGIVRGLERWKIDGKEVELLTVEHLLLRLPPTDSRLRPLATRKTVEAALAALGERKRPALKNMVQQLPLGTARRSNDRPCGERASGARAGTFTKIDIAYRRALDMLAREISAVLGVSYEKAVETIEARLGKR